LKALGIGSGDEVIVPDLTFIATSNAVIMAGALPVFCDILPDTLCLDVESARSRITSHTKAIMPVHLYGQSADMEAITKLASEHGLAVLEDAAQGVGVRFQGQHVGTFGEMGILSFFGNKTITCGEGGIILTNDDSFATACYRLKNHGRDRKGVFIHEEIGFNFSFTEMQAAIGVAQMNKLPRIIQRKKEIHDRYVSALADITALTPCPVDPRTEPVFWFTSFFSNENENLAAWLLERHIQTRRFFYPLHLQPCYQKETAIALANTGSFPVTEDVYRRGLSLPSSYLLTDVQQTIVIENIKGFYEHRA
jgi:perosamine synthetase